jgi:hemerythrin-like metal-binding protein
MKLITWDESFSVKNAAMDKQHQHLVDLINKLHDAMGQGKAKETLPEVFNSLVKYTQSHFADEEALMQKNNYPGLVSHQRQHADLITQVSELQRQFQAGDFGASMKTRDFLKQWLMEHIKETDQKYGAFLNQMGIY